MNQEKREIIPEITMKHTDTSLLDRPPEILQNNQRLPKSWLPLKSDVRTQLRGAPQVRAHRVPAHQYEQGLVSYVWITCSTLPPGLVQMLTFGE